MSTLSLSETVIEMDEKISSYAKFIETVSDRDRPNLQTKLLTAKLMREKFVAMTAFAKAQAIIAEMEVLVAESSLKNACEQLDKVTKELDKKTEKPTSNKSKDSQKEQKKKQSISESRSPMADKENLNKKTSRDTDKNIYKSQSKDETKSNKRKHSDTNHSSSKKSKLSPIKTKPKSKCSKTSLKSPKKLNKTNDFGKLMEIEDNLSSIIGADEETVLIEGLSTIHSLTNITENQKSSKIQIMFEDDERQFRNIKTEALSDLNTSTDNLVNDLFKDIRDAKMREMSKESSSESSNLCKTMLRELLENC